MNKRPTYSPSTPMDKKFVFHLKNKTIKIVEGLTGNGWSPQTRVLVKINDSHGEGN